ncbi:MAG: ADP-ribosylglycohydrolase family protein [Bacteroidota bacterium]
MKSNKTAAALLGVALGDAVGVPYEFKGAAEMKKNPAKDMTGYGTYHQPPGTWSDDSSLTFCLATSLLNGYDLKDISKKFISWKEEAYWSARGELFDIGNTTARAIDRLKDLCNSNNIQELKNQKYYGNETENGNGSLMRILPLLFFIKGKSIKEQFNIIWEVSALTHRHIRAAMSCLIYLKLAEKILEGFGKHEGYLLVQKEIIRFWEEISFAAAEQNHFEKTIKQNIATLTKEEIKSGGYVIESLEASIWCFLNQNNFKDTILSAVNLGHDTDTTAAIAGGLAGLYYGTENIPEFWIASIARMEDIIDLGNQLHKKYF